MKTKIVVDSNIIFSAILSINSRIAQILLTGNEFYDFYAPGYARTEIWRHQEKIKKIAKLDNSDFIEVYELILKNVTILNHSIANKETYSESLELCKDIDPDDIPFIAFSKYLNCKLWTGDKKLIDGLRQKGFKDTISTEELYEDFLTRMMR